MSNGMEMNGRDGTIFVQTNETGANRVLGFRRGVDGTLGEPEAYATGGAGDGSPHLPSQGSVVLSGDRARLFVTNAGSGELSVFALRGESLELLATASSAGSVPRSIAEHDGLVYVLNSGDPSLVGFRVAEHGVEQLADSRRELAPGADPAQVGFAPDGSTLVVTDRANNAIVLFPVDGQGQLGDPRTQPSSGATPYGFAFTEDGTLVVTEAFGAEKGKAAASSYRVRDLAARPVTRSLGNGRSEICWAVVTDDGRWAFTTNFADGAISRYAIGGDGSIALDDAVAGVAVEGATGLRDEALSADGRFLYAIDADGGRIFGWAVREAGRLEQLGSWAGVPPTVAGIAVA